MKLPSSFLIRFSAATRKEKLGQTEGHYYRRIDYFVNLKIFVCQAKIENTKRKCGRKDNDERCEISL
ncbi:MAG: hypothetical protein A3C07_03350 [Candidatus Sungbacteria bacterium RIFCSPHIGHO2_02_FULL_47_11]|uniref:Uncharacterized protein n=1 Tax=Candidatus Sungbacteria bacterium RIFCSPHIGHO2_02_FULL_47_11 TaxID=1802270 RepID=A0A1G2KQM6_9BACT|nr:MAG: hypothetical protein A3C07_03350 [Candidatus Sungbacteria bacterium RIFCSPHIGHO2_02_FULL_47_11]